MPDEDKIYTIEQVAKKLAVSPDTVQTWMEEGKLGSVKIGYRTVRILQSDIDNFIRDHHRESNYPFKRVRT
jgi:excisionase family DNA binding protein